MKKLLWMGAILSLMMMGGCSKDPVKIISAQVVDDMDKGSGNFDRVLKICFDKPISSDYYHKIILVTNEAFKLDGGNYLKPMASDPDNKCQYRNLYTYIHKDSPLNARQMIKDYVRPGNISQLLIQIYNDKPEGKEIPVDEKLFKNI
ncbi:hypothetical protein [Thiosulfativibrio zosterae]|uniref:Lipoprotein n=1 Tax=Thiosulfativibrio zosterae TaxID=2675053 RepID=A0A6F8PKQ6_9GAMM|nr:hypothetical protein [Thiosulfativibrio zosterae]BBP42644.1 hypothetical protein THMIRHAT_03900 [Thiosulfativibrio zosterae]